MTRKLILLAAIAALSDASAFAIDSKSYAGAECVPVTGNWTGSDTHYGRIRNLSTNSITYICPILKDETLRSISGGRIYVLDNNTAENVTCNIFSRHETTTGPAGGYWRAQVVTTGNSSIMRALPLPSITTNTPSATMAVWYYIECTIPAGGIIYSYLVDENS